MQADAEGGSRAVLRVLVVGAGPIGVEAALAFTSRGHEVTVVEASSEPFAHVRNYAHVRLFSPWRLHTSELGLSVVGQHPPMDDFPTGQQFISEYLEPVVDYLRRQGSFHLLLDRRAVSIARSSLLKKDMARPSSSKFRVLVERASAAGGGDEMYLEGFDVVLDCSGSYALYNWLGAGGTPAVGERSLAGRIERYVPDVAKMSNRYLNRDVAVVGCGFSAITALKALVDLAADSPQASLRVRWLTRRPADAAPYRRIPGDSLPQRDALSRLGNEIAAGAAELPANLDVRYTPGVEVSRVQAAGAGEGARITLTLTGRESGEESGSIEVDEVISLTGYRPDRTLYDELHVHECFATQGPMRLAASLMAAAGGSSGDCLALPAPGPATLVNPEANFFILGAKSHGRSSSFLIGNGIEQVSQVLQMLDDAEAARTGEAAKK